MRMSKTCEECGLAFKTTQPHGKFCSPACSNINQRKRRGKFHYKQKKECQHCGGIFESKDVRQRFCSFPCQRADSNRAFREMNAVGQDIKLSTGAVGAIAELVVAADLLTRGYEVFRALSPDSSCDLAILKNHTLYRVEVTTVYMNKSGNVVTRNRADPARNDIVANVVRKDRTIVYVPELPNEEA